MLMSRFDYRVAHDGLYKPTAAYMFQLEHNCEQKLQHHEHEGMLVHVNLPCLPYLLVLLAGHLVSAPISPT